MHAQVLDFPLFVNDGGSSLKTDLGVRWLFIGAVPMARMPFIGYWSKLP